MTDPASKPAKPSLTRRFSGWLCRWRTVRRGLIGFACFVTFVALFYTVEDWRGKRAWEQCKRDLTAKGEMLDWAAYIPPPVPDDQNFFKAPKMQEWFVGKAQTELYKKSKPANFDEFVRQRETNIVAEITVVSPGAAVVSSNVDVTLRYDAPFLMIEGAQKHLPFLSETETSTIPLIVMENVPLSDAIRELARRANLNYTLGSNLNAEGLWLLVKDAPQPVVSLRWENITARHALLALLSNYNLQLKTDSKTGSAQITFKDSDGPQMSVDWDARESISSLIRTTIEKATNNLPGPTFKSPQGLILRTGRANPMQPVRIVVLADKTPTLEEVVDFFPKTTRGTIGPDRSQLRVEARGGNAFCVLLVSPPVCAATDYLAWTDRFESDFAAIREALKRPYARMDVDYRQPFGEPFPNFVMVRMIAQTLASRAQCHFLLNQPEEALRELTLMHDLCRPLEGAPTGKPMTLVSAMIKVAVTGLYANTIADGFKLNAWHDPQLITLTAQLKSVDCLPQLDEAFRGERVAAAYTLENTRPRDIADQYLYFNGASTNLWERLKIPIYPFLTFAPRGWVYQNLVTRAVLVQSELATYDLKNHVILPGKVAEVTTAMDRLNAHHPYTFLVVQYSPPFVRALQTLAQNQTKVNEALIVCALERYHLAGNNYPETLDVLTPRFIDNLPHDLIGGQPLKYRRTADGKFLLYSVGWNETDDGGKVVLDEFGKPKINEGDWVWQ